MLAVHTAGHFTELVRVARLMRRSGRYEPTVFFVVDRTVYRPDQFPQVFEGDDELTGDPELPGFRCRVADLFYLPGEEGPPAPATPASPA